MSVFDGAVWLVAASLSSAPVDLSERAEVMREAEQLWSADEMQAMAGLFERAYAVDPVPEYLFGQARARVKLGECKRARALLEAFIATEPPASQLEAAYTEQDKCPEDAPATPVPTTVAPVAPQPAPAETATQAADDAKTTPAPLRLDAATDPRLRPDALGWSLVGVGIASVAVGTGLFFAGRGAVINPAATATETEYQADTRRGQRMGWAGLGVGLTGVGLVVGGAIRLSLVRRRDDRRGRRAAQR